MNGNLKSAARKIEVVPYSPDWVKAFESEREELKKLWGGEIISIHHIGSTSIPGLSAKPVVDVLVEVKTIEKIDEFNSLMFSRGYLSKGEAGIQGRRFFIKGTDIHRTHHIHVFQAGHPDIERHIRFRDYMISHPDEAGLYEQLKLKLARDFPADIKGYIEGKDSFLKEMDRKATRYFKG